MLDSKPYHLLGALRLGLPLALLVGGIVACNNSDDISQEKLIGVESIDGSCSSASELALINGKILTVDENNSIFSSLLINGDTITDVGDDIDFGPCVEVIDLQGRTVTPGLINNHNHFLRAAIRPGIDVRELEFAFSITALQEILTAKAATIPVNAGTLSGRDFLHYIDAYHPRQLAEERHPTRAELTSAVPDHPVMIMQYPFGPIIVNDTATAFLVDAGLTVPPDGVLGNGTPTELGTILGVHRALTAGQTVADKKRSLRNLMRYAAETGLTGFIDGGGGFPAFGAFDESRDYEALQELFEEGNIPIRARAVIQAVINDDNKDDPETGLPSLQTKADLIAGFNGDGHFSYIGFGENLVGGPLPPFPDQSVYEAAFRIVAENGLSLQQHAISTTEMDMFLSAMEAVNADTPVADLHWMLSHIQAVTDDHFSRMKAIGVGAAVQIHFMNGAFFGEPLGTPSYRQVFDSGVEMSAGTDASYYSPFTWLWHMTTGLQNNGEVALQVENTLTREEALRISTVGSAWNFLEEDRLGSIEVGKLADVVVLSADYLTVPDDQLRTVKSVLTLVGGKIIYSDNTVVSCSDGESSWHVDGSDDRCNY